MLEALKLGRRDRAGPRPFLWVIDEVLAVFGADVIDAAGERTRRFVLQFAAGERGGAIRARLQVVAAPSAMALYVWS